MPGKKKTNYIALELKKLDAWYKQAEAFMDKNPPDEAVDRMKPIYGREGEIVRYQIISSIEDQVKLFMSNLEKLPKLLTDINTLRLAVERGKEEETVRGGAERPGFMDDEDDEDEKPKTKFKQNKSKKTDDDEDSKFDDDAFFDGDDEREPEEPKESEETETPPGNDDDPEGEDGWLEKYEDR